MNYFDNDEMKPPTDIEILTASEMFFSYRMGWSSLGLFAGSPKFQQVINDHGSEIEKIRLAELGVGYQYKPTPTELTLSTNDHNFLAACGIKL